MRKILVKTNWDEEASALVVTSEHVPELVVKGRTAEELESKLSVLTSELLKEQNIKVH